MKRLGTVSEWRVCHADLGWMVWITLHSEQGSLLLVWNCICFEVFVPPKMDSNRKSKGTLKVELFGLP